MQVSCCHSATPAWIADASTESRKLWNAYCFGRKWQCSNFVRSSYKMQLSVITIVSNLSFLGFDDILCNASVKLFTNSKVQSFISLLYEERVSQKDSTNDLANPDLQ